MSSRENRTNPSFLPTLTIALWQIAFYSRYQRSAMLDVLGSEFLRTAQAKGLFPAVDSSQLSAALTGVAFELAVQVKAGAGVEIAGVQVGQVKRIGLRDDRALVVLSLRPGVKIYGDAIASIRTRHCGFERSTR